MEAKERSKSHYEANKEIYKARARRQRLAIRDWYNQLKSGPCLDCKVSYPPYVMHFDHVKEGKIADLCSLVRTCSKSKILEEIDKCELVCANCHAERTHQRGISSAR